MKTIHIYDTELKRYSTTVSLVITTYALHIIILTGGHHSHFILHQKKKKKNETLSINLNLHQTNNPSPIHT